MIDSANFSITSKTEINICHVITFYAEAELKVVTARCGHVPLSIYPSRFFPCFFKYERVENKR